MEVENSIRERQGVTTKMPQTLGGAELYCREAEYTAAPDIWGDRALQQRAILQQPRSPRHFGAQSSTTERENTTTKEPKKFRDAPLH